MPRRRKPPRLNFRADEGLWIIHDGADRIRTGCGADDSRGAEKALARYLDERFTPAAREHSPAQLTVAEVLTAYGREHAPTTKGSSPEMAGYNIAALLPYWGKKTLMDIRGNTCREYMALRGKSVKPGSIRRELAILSAAINYWHREHGPLDSIPVVTLPPKSPARAHWLTRGQAAVLLAGALGWYRERWSDVATRKERSRWHRDQSAINRSAARFILLGLYTGTRHAAILAVQWMPNTSGGWVNLESGVLYRRGVTEEETSKRRGPLKLGRRILAHLRRWHGIDEAIRDQEALETGQPCTGFFNIVAYEGQPIQKLRKPWYSAVELSALGSHVTPHILRHTRVTWWVQAGLTLEEVADAASMTVQMVEEVYWHHSPDFQKRAAEA
jgi:integrase